MVEHRDCATYCRIRGKPEGCVDDLQRTSSTYLTDLIRLSGNPVVETKGVEQPGPSVEVLSEWGGAANVEAAVGGEHEPYPLPFREVEIEYEVADAAYRGAGTVPCNDLVASQACRHRDFAEEGHLFHCRDATGDTAA